MRHIQFKRETWSDWAFGFRRFSQHVADMDDGPVYVHGWELYFGPFEIRMSA